MRRQVRNWNTKKPPFLKVLYFICHILHSSYRLALSSIYLISYEYKENSRDMIKHRHTRKDPNMAMEERKCQVSWSSKNESRMQSLLCSRDSAGVFCVSTNAHSKLLLRHVRI